VAPVERWWDRAYRRLARRPRPGGEEPAPRTT